MAETIKYFDGITLKATGADGVFYSPIINSVEYNSITSSIRALTFSGASLTITGQVQTTFDPSYEDSSWVTIDTVTIAATGTPGSGVAASTPFRYLRAKVTVPNGSEATLYFESSARSK